MVSSSKKWRAGRRPTYGDSYLLPTTYYLLPTTYYYYNYYGRPTVTARYHQLPLDLLLAVTRLGVTDAAQG